MLTGKVHAGAALFTSPQCTRELHWRKGGYRVVRPIVCPTLSKIDVVSGWVATTTYKKRRKEDLAHTIVQGRSVTSELHDSTKSSN